MGGVGSGLQHSAGPRQWPEVSDFVACFCTLRESENTRTCENCTCFQKTHGRELHAFCVQFSHVRVFCDSRNVQKSVTRIIYLWPLPNGPWPVSCPCSNCPGVPKHFSGTLCLKSLRTGSTNALVIFNEFRLGPLKLICCSLAKLRRVGEP